MTATIRPARAPEQAAIVELMAAQLADQGIAIDRTPLAQAIDGVFADPARGFLLVVESDSRLIGAAYVSFMWSLEHGGASAWLEELYLRPEERGRGLGSRLLLAAMRRARAAGCTGMDLEVAEANQRVESLYRRNGFRSLGRRRWARSLESV